MSIICQIYMNFVVETRMHNFCSSMRFLFMFSKQRSCAGSVKL